MFSWVDFVRDPLFGEFRNEVSFIDRYSSLLATAPVIDYEFENIKTYSVVFIAEEFIRDTGVSRQLSVESEKFLIAGLSGENIVDAQFGQQLLATGIVFTGEFISNSGGFEYRRIDDGSLNSLFYGADLRAYGGGDFVRYGIVVEPGLTTVIDQPVFQPFEVTTGATITVTSVVDVSNAFEQFGLFRTVGVLAGEGGILVNDGTIVGELFDIAASDTTVVNNGTLNSSLLALNLAGPGPDQIYPDRVTITNNGTLSVESIPGNFRSGPINIGNSERPVDDGSNSDDSVITNNGTIEVFNSNLDRQGEMNAISLAGDRGTVTNTGTITVFETFTDAIRVTGADGFVQSSSNSLIEIQGAGSQAIFINGDRGQIEADGEILADVGFSAIVGINGDGADIDHFGDLTGFGAYVAGLAAIGPDFEVSNSGNIELLEVTSAGIAGLTYAYDRDNDVFLPASTGTILNSGAINTSALQGYGILGVGVDLDIANQAAGRITTTGQGAHAISLGISPFILLPEEVDILPSLFTLVNQAEEVLNAGAITVSGQFASGIFSDRSRDSTFRNEGTITAVSAATDKRGMFLSGNRLEAINADGAEITVSGPRATGINLTGETGSVANEAGASLAASGTDSVGVFLENTLAGTFAPIRNLGDIDADGTGIRGVGGWISVTNGEPAMPATSTNAAIGAPGGDLETGIDLDGPNLKIDNHGAIEATDTGVRFTNTDTSSFTNFDGATVLQTGESGEAVALSGTMLTVENRGAIESELADGMVIEGDNAKVTNYNDVSAAHTGLTLSGNDVTLTNLVAENGESSAPFPQIRSTNLADPAAQTIAIDWSGNDATLINHGQIIGGWAGIEYVGNALSITHGKGRETDARIEARLPGGIRGDGLSVAGISVTAETFNLESFAPIESTGHGVVVTSPDAALAATMNLRSDAIILADDGIGILAFGLPELVPAPGSADNASALSSLNVFIDRDAAIKAQQGADVSELEAVTFVLEGEIDANGVDARGIAVTSSILETVSILMSGRLSADGANARGIAVDAPQAAASGQTRQIVVELDPALAADTDTALTVEGAEGVGVFADMRGLQIENTAGIEVTGDMTRGVVMGAQSSPSDDMEFRNSAALVVGNESLTAIAPIAVEVNADDATVFNGQGAGAFPDLELLLSEGILDPRIIFSQEFDFESTTSNVPIFPLGSMEARGTDAIGALVRGSGVQWFNVFQQDSDANLALGAVVARGANSVGIKLEGGGNTIYNDGVIQGVAHAILGSDSNDFIVNRLELRGDTALGGGNDVFFAFAGGVTGAVDGGVGGLDLLFVGSPLSSAGPAVPVVTFDGTNFTNFESLEVIGDTPIILKGRFDSDTAILTGELVLDNAVFEGDVDAVDAFLSGSGQVASYRGDALSALDIAAGSNATDLTARLDEAEDLALSPSFGTLTIDTTFETDGTIFLEIGGPSASQRDRLDILGAADLSAATIVLDFVDGFRPEANTPVEILSAGTLAAGSTNAEIVARGLGAASEATLSLNAATGALAVAFSFPEITGSDDKDTLLGTAAGETISALAEADLIEAGGGNDLIFAGPGRDRAFGGDGADSLDGGNGDDVVRGGLGNDTLTGGRGDDKVFGESGHDTLFGGQGNGADVLRGNDGNDLMFGQGGNDALFGGNGDDALTGGAGGDHLRGGRGVDTLNGGEGDDTLAGGGNADVFVFAGAFGNDVLEDFDALTKGEVIDLSGISEIADFDDLASNHLSDVNGDAVITAGANTITLKGVASTTLGADNFAFGPDPASGGPQTGAASSASADLVALQRIESSDFPNSADVVAPPGNETDIRPADLGAVSESPTVEWSMSL